MFWCPTCLLIISSLLKIVGTNRSSVVILEYATCTFVNLFLLAFYVFYIHKTLSAIEILLLIYITHAWKEWRVVFFLSHLIWPMSKFTKWKIMPLVLQPRCHFKVLIHIYYVSKWKLSILSYKQASIKKVFTRFKWLHIFDNLVLKLDNKLN